MKGEAVMKNLSTAVNINKKDSITYSRLHIGDYLLPADFEERVIPPFKVRYITLGCCE